MPITISFLHLFKARACSNYYQICLPRFFEIKLSYFGPNILVKLIWTSFILASCFLCWRVCWSSCYTFNMQMMLKKKVIEVPWSLPTLQLKWHLLLVRRSRDEICVPDFSSAHCCCLLMGNSNFSTLLSLFFPLLFCSRPVNRFD